MLKKMVYLILTVLVFSACTTKNADEQTETPATETTQDVAKVQVIYFHGKQRCKTCMAIEKVTSETIAANFADNKEVAFSAVDFSLPENDALAEKYEIAWSSLIIASGDKHVDMTEEAFATALKDPETLKKRIIEETNQFLNQ